MDLTDEQKKETVRKAWLCENDGTVPYIVELGGFHASTNEFHENDEWELEWTHRYHESMGPVQDYNIPNIKPNIGIGLIAAAFGCEQTPNDEGDPWIRPLITRDNVEDVYSLAELDVKENPVFKRAYQRLEFLQRRSSFPLRLANIASPLVAGSQIWEYTSFIESMLLDPEAVHRLLDMVTGTIIRFVREQLERIENLYTMGHEPWHIPPDVGLRISDDTAAVMSPSTVEEFGTAYNARISEAFGGLVWHSCGNVANVLPNILRTPRLKGIDIVATQNDWKTIRDQMQGHRVGMSLRYNYWDFPDSDQVDQLVYSKELVDFFDTEGILLLTSTRTLQETTDLAAGLSQAL